MLENNRFKLDDFEFKKNKKAGENERSLVPSFTPGEKLASLILHSLSFVITTVFFVLSLRYVIINPNTPSSQGGIGNWGISSLCLFFVSFLAVTIYSFLYRNKLNTLEKERTFNKIRLILDYVACYSFLLFFSSTALRKDICGNALVDVWKGYGVFIAILATVITAGLIVLTYFVKSDYTIRLINIGYIFAISTFVISNFYILKSSIVVDTINMWTIIAGFALELISLIVLYVGKEKNNYYNYFLFIFFIGLFATMFGLIYYGLEMPSSIPNLSY